MKNTIQFAIQTVFSLFILIMSISANAQWQITGNTNIGANNFLGTGTGETDPLIIKTTEQSPIILKTYDIERMRISGGGLFGIGNNAPAFAIDITNNTTLRTLNLYHSLNVSSLNSGFYSTALNLGNGKTYAYYADLPSASSGIGEQAGYFANIAASGNTGQHYGFYSNMTGASTGGQYGYYTNLENTGSGAHYGNYSLLTGIGSGKQYGTYSEINVSGSGSKYGSYTTITSTKGTHYGYYSTLSGNSNGIHYGSYNSLGGSGTGWHYGNYNVLYEDGIGYQYGTYNSITNSGSGIHYGYYSALSGAGTGDQYGSYSEITNSQNGIHYGNKVSLSGSGTATHYGFYSDLSGSGSGAQIGASSNITNTASGDHYGFKASVSGGGTCYGVYSAALGSGTNYSFYGVGDGLLTGKLILLTGEIKSSPDINIEQHLSIGSENGNPSALRLLRTNHNSWELKDDDDGILKLLWSSDNFSSESTPVLRIGTGGQVAIGTDDFTYLLNVKGTIRATEIRVETGWGDYVFDKDYKRMSLDELNKYINSNHHLPNIPSAEEIQCNGLPLAEVTTKMMEKIEELTLYIIELKTENDELTKRMYCLER